METRTLGGTDLKVSRLCLGTMTFGAQVDEPTAASMVDLCLEQGINFFDTANVYNAGVTESILGRILGGRRERIVLATKVGIKMGEAPDERGLSRAAILKGIDDSLRRLQTDYVDLFYLHQPDYTVPLEESLQTVDELIRAGKVRYGAASNFASWQICHMLWLADKHHWQPVRVLQPMYNLLARAIDQEFLPMVRQFGLSVVAYNPLAGGMLTGKHRPDVVPPGTRFDKMPVYKDRYWHPATFQAVRQLGDLAERSNRSLVSVAYGWLLGQPGVDCVIVGASRLEQLQQNIQAAQDGPLAAEGLVECNKVWSELRGVSPPYNR